MSLVVANLAMLAFASYGTSSTILTWTLFLLAQHPAIMGDLVDELSAAGPVEDMELAGLSSLPLLDAVLKEAMRLITPVPFLGFRAVRSCEIAGRQLDRGARVVISPHLTHRMTEIYDAPDRFRPHRWFEIKPTSYEYLPFSAGARRCPGSLFATMVLKTMLAVILSRYRVTVSRGARIDYTFAGIIVPKRGVPMQLERQDRAFTANPCTGSIFELVKSDGPV